MCTNSQSSDPSPHKCPSPMHMGSNIQSTNTSADSLTSFHQGKRDLKKCTVPSKCFYLVTESEEGAKEGGGGGGGGCLILSITLFPVPLFHILKEHFFHIVNTYWYVCGVYVYFFFPPPLLPPIPIPTRGKLAILCSFLSLCPSF